MICLSSLADVPRNPTSLQPAVAFKQVLPSWLVFGVWGFLSLLYLLFVYRYGLNIPISDEWLDIVPFLTGEKPTTLLTLWAQFHQHRIFATNALLVPILHYTGSFRAVMFINAFILIGAVGLLLSALKRTRGRLVWTDMIIPLIFLHWNHYENFLWAFQVQFIWSTAVVLALLSFMLNPQQSRTTRNTVIIGCLLLSLPLFGASGFLFLPAGVIWYITTRWHNLPVVPPGSAGGEAGQKRAVPNRTVALFLVLLTGVLMGLYLYHFVPGGVDPAKEYIARTSPVGNPPPVPVAQEETASSPKISPLQVVRAATYFGNMGLGLVAKPGFRPSLTPLNTLLALVLPLLYICAFAIQVRNIRQKNEPSFIFLGFAGLMATVALEAVTIGVVTVREASHSAGLSFADFVQGRYSLLSGVGLVVVYLTFSLFARRTGRLLATALAVLTLFYTPFNFFFGHRAATEKWAFGKGVTTALASGHTTPSLLLSRYGETIVVDYIGWDYLVHAMTGLHRVGFKPFDTLRPEPPVHQIGLTTLATDARPVDVPAMPASVSHIVLTRKVSGTPHLYGLRLVFADTAHHSYRLYWRSHNVPYQVADSRPFSLPPDTPDLTLTVYPDAPVSDFCVQRILSTSDDLDAKPTLQLKSVRGLKEASSDQPH